MGDSSSKLQESTLSDDFAFQGSGGGSGKHVIALMDAVANRFTLVCRIVVWEMKSEYKR